MSRSKDKGTRWETACVNHLREAGAVHAERRALHGSVDQGDVTGVPGTCHEMKAEKSYNLAGWTAELLAEMVNAGVDIGAVWAKRVGKTSPADGYIITTPAVWLRLLGQAGYIAAPTDEERAA